MKELIEKIRNRILSDKNVRVTAKSINKIVCPQCDKREAFAYYDEPMAIICHRNKECGATTPIKQVYPDLFENFSKQYPATKEEPNLTAQKYLESRGLNPIKIKYSQDKYYVKDCNKSFDTVVFEQNGIKQHRLIDYKGGDKNRFAAGTSFKNNVYETKSVAIAKKIYITEGIIDALSLEQSNCPAIATYSSGSVPVEYYEKHKDKTFVIAYDNDNAGKQGIEKTIACFKELGINYQIILPPDDMDWNDLLVKGDLGPDKIQKTLELCHWRGRLFAANSANDYFEIYSEHNNSPIFTYNNATYKGHFKIITNQENGEITRNVKTFMLTDCELRLRYSIVDDSIEYNNQTTNIVEIKSTTNKAALTEFNAKEISSPTAFREKLAHHRQISNCSQDNLNQITQYLFSQPSPVVRKLQSIGYDKKSGCYVFSDFLYDKQGNRHELNKQGFFEKQKLMPFKDELCINAIEEASPKAVKEFVLAIENAFGKNGLIALGFYISTSFSHIIFKKYGSFPILNLYHAKDTGKSTLIDILNQMFLVDWSGIPIGSGNTKKGELRKLSQKSSLVTPLSEWRLNSIKNIFDPSSVLNAFNRLPLEIRAKKTNGNETVEIPFNGALCFVQNDYPFMTEPEQERVIDLRFEDGSLNVKSDGFKYLISLSPQQIAGVGDFILKNRLFFEEHINATIDKAKERLTADGIKNRIAINHATAFAGTQLVARLLKLKDLSMETLYQDIQKIGLTKVRNSSTQLDIADYFFSIVDRLQHDELTGIARIDDSLYIHMTAIFKYIKEEYSDTLNKDTLFTQLRSHKRFVKANYNKQMEFDSNKKVMKVWEFKTSNDNIALTDIKPQPLDYADLFLGAIEELADAAGVMNGNIGDDHIYVQMHKVLTYLSKEKRLSFNQEKLFSELRKHPRYMQSDYIETKNLHMKGKCWVFEKTAIY